MSVRVVQGNLLDAKEDIIVHQVNCQGVMGGGVAKQIKEKWPVVFEHYKRVINTVKRKNMPLERLLGNISWDIVACAWSEGVHNKWVASIYAQVDYNRRGEKRLQTDYEALRKALTVIADEADWSDQSVAMPYLIGCGRGGGDWEGVVYPMICEVFSDYPDVDVVLYKYTEQ